jgi:hypothetical protein
VLTGNRSVAAERVDVAIAEAETIDVVLVRLDAQRTGRTCSEIAGVDAKTIEESGLRRQQRE